MQPIPLFGGNIDISDEIQQGQPPIPRPPIKNQMGLAQQLGIIPPDQLQQQAQPQQRKVIKVSDPRQIDFATGQKLGEGNRMSSNVDMELANMIVSKAREHGIDPATALSMGLNETGLSFNPQKQTNSKYNIPIDQQLKQANPFMVGSHDELINDKGVREGVGEQVAKNGSIDTFMRILKERMATGQKIGKKDEASIIQAYNGYGKINKGTLYGIDTEKNPIDFNQNPIYGKKILDIRENIVKKNPELMALINPPPTR